jgi:hypothetical protein
VAELRRSAMNYIMNSLPITYKTPILHKIFAIIITTLIALTIVLCIEKYLGKTMSGVYGMIAVICGMRLPKIIENTLRICLPPKT